jgi:hypothetical protein
VDDKENFQQFAQADDGGVVADLDHFVMPRRSRADLLVCGVYGVAVAIARLHGSDALYAQINRFGAPKAAAA